MIDNGRESIGQFDPTLCETDTVTGHGTTPTQSSGCHPQPLFLSLGFVNRCLQTTGKCGYFCTLSLSPSQLSLCTFSFLLTTRPYSTIYSSYVHPLAMCPQYVSYLRALHHVQTKLSSTECKACMRVREGSGAHSRDQGAWELRSASSSPLSFALPFPCCRLSIGPSGWSHWLSLPPPLQLIARTSPTHPT